MSKPFYNTISVTGQTLMNFTETAISQEERVKNVYLSERRPLAWFEVKSLLPDMNDCSIKRSITNLKGRGFLKIIKDELIQGTYGKPVHRYKML